MAREKQHHKIGRSQDFSVGEMKLVELDAREVGVIRLHNRELRAVMNRCPHKGAHLSRHRRRVGVHRPGRADTRSARDVLVCPWHGFEFDLKTGREVSWRQRRVYECIRSKT